jgi:hypothetical protein
MGGREDEGVRRKVEDGGSMIEDRGQRMEDGGSRMADRKNCGLKMGREGKTGGETVSR